MKSSVVAKRSIVIASHKTSVSLEDPFWAVLKELAREREQTLSELVAIIDHGRQEGNLSSAIRLFVLGAAAKDKYKPALEGGVAPAKQRSGEAAASAPA